MHCRYATKGEGGRNPRPATSLHHLNQPPHQPNPTTSIMNLTTQGNDTHPQKSTSHQGPNRVVTLPFPSVQSTLSLLPANGGTSSNQPCPLKQRNTLQSAPSLKQRVTITLVIINMPTSSKQNSNTYKPPWMDTRYPDTVNSTQNPITIDSVRFL